MLYGYILDKENIDFDTKERPENFGRSFFLNFFKKICPAKGKT